MTPELLINYKKKQKLLNLYKIEVNANDRMRSTELISLLKFSLLSINHSCQPCQLRNMAYLR
jgi:hypothetical protein